MKELTEKEYQSAKTIVLNGLEKAAESLSFFMNEKIDRKSTRLNSSHLKLSRMPSSA